MIVFVAISNFHYNTTNTVQFRKTRRRILNAATRLVCYNEGYAEPNSDLKTIENCILSMNTYCLVLLLLDQWMLGEDGLIVRWNN